MTGMAEKHKFLVSPLMQLQALVLLAVMLGGGGVAYGLHNLAVQLAALATLAANAGRVGQFVSHGPRLLVALVIATLALPLVQLVPLPPSLWQELPGRAAVIEGVLLAGGDERTFAPLSLDRARTLVAFFGTIAPATLVAVGTMLTREERQRLAMTIAGAALAALLLGAVQLASANSSGMIYPIRPAPDVLYASFANRNSTGLLFVLALLLLIALPLRQARLWLLARCGAGTLLALGVVLTQSRSAMALLAVVAGYALLRGIAFMLEKRGRANVPTATIAGIAALAFVAVLAASTLSGGRVAQSIERFGNLETDRLEMWDDAAFAARQYWPAGSGMGTFDEVFQLHESLEYVSPRTAGRAHNDYLEIAIEGGMAALLLAAAWLGWALVSTLRPPCRADRWIALGAGAGIGCIALQSILDYPLRNQALLCVAAVLVVLLAGQARAAR